MKFVTVTDAVEMEMNVPDLLKSMVKYLNTLVSCGPEMVTKLLDSEVPCDGGLLEAKLPHLIVRGTQEAPALSGLGILAGFVNTDRYRLFAKLENDTPPYGNIISFGIFRVENDTTSS